MTKDEQVLAKLKELDEDDDVEVSDWEAEFLESVLVKLKCPYRSKTLSPKQREKANEILERYGKT